MTDQKSHLHKDAGERKMWWKSKFVLAGFLMVSAYFLWTEHRAHVIEFLPYSLLGACLLMHFFMHRGHGHHHDAPPDKNNKKED